MARRIRHTPPMRLPAFIQANTEAILVEWDAFARSIWPEGVQASPQELRDHAAEILQWIAGDMQTHQTLAQRLRKSRGDRGDDQDTARLDPAAKRHAVGRASSGMEMEAVVAEYRALRASVIRLWSESAPDPDAHDLDDLTRFNEAIDESLAEAVRAFTEHLDQSRQMFLSVLGHDLRSPLNAIATSAQVLLDRPGDERDVADLALQIATSAGAMDQLLSDFLDFTRSRLGQGIPIATAPMDLGALCEEVIREMRAAHPKHDLELVQHGDLAGQWDRRRLRQLVSNLLGNAVQHGADGHIIKLTVRADPPNVHLAVYNSGPPIPPEVLPRVFDPMVRGATPDATARSVSGNLGLGLYIAREVVVAHGGTINVNSSADGGTTFNIRLPSRPRNRVA